MHPRIFLLFPVLVWGLTTSAQAGMLHITIDDLTLAPGEAGTADVTLRYSSDLMDPESIQLRSFDFKFQITSDDLTQLQFRDPQGDLQLNDPDYVFANGSARRDGILTNPPEEVGSVNGDINETFIGGDSAIFIGDMGINLPSSAEVGRESLLLARLELVPGSGSFAPEVGNVFAISLIEDSQTEFLDDSSPSNLIAFTSTPGTVTITQSQTIVPEPSALVLFALGGLGLLGFGLCRWRRAQNSFIRVQKRVGNLSRS